jgi:hypothetical protein
MPHLKLSLAVQQPTDVEDDFSMSKLRWRALHDNRKAHAGETGRFPREFRSEAAWSVPGSNR